MAEKIEEDDPSWSEVQGALILTAATSAIFLTIFEVARRHPALVSSVFDRRRNSKPNRTPPPLIRNSLFEWMFLSNEPRYSEYSDLSHMRNVILERRRQRGKVSKCNDQDSRTGLGCLSSWRRKKARNDDDSKSDDSDLNSQQSDHSLDPVASISHSDEINLQNPYGIEVHREPSGSMPSTRNKPLKIQRYLTPDVVEINGRRLPKEIAEYALANDLTEDQLEEYEQALIEQETADEVEYLNRVRSMKARYERRGSLLPNGQDLSPNTGGGGGGGDEENLQDPRVFNFDHSNLEDRKKDGDLSLPSRPRRFFYFNFSQGYIKPKERMISRNTQRVRTLSPRSILSRARLWTSNRSRFTFKSSSSGTESPYNSPTSTRKANAPATAAMMDDGIYINRHLKSTSVTEKRPLTESDTELLRCIGLDTFVMIRFLRFCFDVTWYPFLLSIMILIPTYSLNEYDGIEYTQNLKIDTQTEGYFRWTMNRLEPGTAKTWVPFGFNACFVIFILRRIWIEWETFIALRFDFMANGDAEHDEGNVGKGDFNFKSRALLSPRDDAQLHLEQYRNSCIVEYIPESHQRDVELFQFFEAVFPDQVKRAEILLNATKLELLVKQRQGFIENYESIYAKHQHAKKKYYHKKDGGNSDRTNLWYCLRCKCIQGEPKKPEDPTITLGKNRLLFCCGGKRIKAIPYLLQEINRLNREANKEHRRISEEKKSAEDRDEQKDIVTANLAVAKDFITGTTQELRCSTGFVEFKNLTAKQSALQCNLTGTNGYMVLRPAPDPRDMLWKNATVERKFIKIKRLQCDAILFTGLLFWSIVVSALTVISDLEQVKKYLPNWLVPEEDTFWYNLVEGYLPVVFLELLMLIVPFILRIIATNFIRFKTHSETDQYVYTWHFAYRVMNLIIIIVKHQVLKTIDSILTSPQATIDTLAAGIAQSSQFFLNNMIVAAGTETFFELCQLPSIIRHFVVHQFITIEASSKRNLERMQAPMSFEWGDTMPKFIFALLVGTVYCAYVPIVTFACASFFYIAAKVYTHQALFVYAQPYEGGGKLMYQLNRSVFVIVYTTISLFSVLLSLKGNNLGAGLFLFSFNILTFLVDRRVTKKFIKPGLTLALTNARLIDEQNNKKEERRRAYEEYKAIKLAKRKEANRAAKALQIKTYNEATNLLPPRPSTRSDNRTKQTRFQLGPDHQPRISNPRHPRAKVNPKSHDSSDSEDDDNAEEKGNFYFYRQPHMNKSEWETRPRPYHG